MIVKEWLDKEESSNSEWNSIVQTRLKLARNMAWIPFPDNMTTAEAAEVNDKVSQVVQKWNETGPVKFTPVSVSALSEGEKNLLLESGIDFPEGGNSQWRKLYLSDSWGMAILTNGDDHFTAWALSHDGNLTETWEKLSKLDDFFSQYIPFAFDHEFGYLTASPLMAGTGLSVRETVFIPGISQLRQIENLAGKLARSGYRIGAMERNASEFFPFYVIENSYSMGVSEKGLCNRLEEANKNIEFVEDKAWNTWYSAHEELCKDKAWRAIGTLSYARSLPYREGVECFAWIYNGIRHKLLPAQTKAKCLQLLKMLSTSYVEQKVQQEGLSEKDSNRWRAVIVREFIKAMNI